MASEECALCSVALNELEFVEATYMVIKYLEWNVNARGGRKGYEIPPFVPEYAVNKQVDVMVFVEYRQGDNWDLFKKILEKDYELCVSPYASEFYNQVCIALRHDKFKVEKTVAVDVCNINIPEFFQINVKVIDEKVLEYEKSLSIIGTRIKTQGDSKEAQYTFLKEHLNSFNTVLCLGDFNCTHTTLKDHMGEELKVGGPRIANGYYSFVHKNGDKRGLDWVITKGISKVYNPYNDKSKSPYATYDWNFITDDNGYVKKTKDDNLNIEGLPDHAILKGAIEI